MNVGTVHVTPRNLSDAQLLDLRQRMGDRVQSVLKDGHASDALVVLETTMAKLVVAFMAQGIAPAEAIEAIAAGIGRKVEIIIDQRKGSAH